ncbi:hypothetical protein AKG95_29215 (plasmid) [Janthinobacterium lividum]|jgi:hypothetical protein|uniref:Uncharacterized protein n=1 Tax=Janthinobacterium lividum TaxID=29581 RepID=A0A1S1TZY8_9BURK|nr:hypothetical protein [Janthinobacterium lividum]OHV93812.1 hypothetical protein AKG95_29215 [Janthinobacterium lividum]
MPRTVETIVANHQAAAALRAAGKPIWPRKVNIKTILREDQSSEDPAVIADKANRIAKLLRAQAPARLFDCTDPDCDYDFVDAVEMMEECTVASLAVDLENGVEAVDMMNGWLEAVYDWADANRVWLGN